MKPRSVPHHRPLRRKAIGHVFLSYNGRDVRKARKIARMLWQAGISVNMYNPRDPWEDSMMMMHRLIPGATCVVWFANHSPPTDWILPELEWAANNKVPILRLDWMAHVREVVKAIRLRDFSHDMAEDFFRENIGEADGTAEGEWHLMERLFYRQLAEGVGSRLIGQFNWFARLESESNTAHAAICVLLVLGPPMFALYLLVAAAVAVFFSETVAWVLVYLALACVVVTPMTWKLSGRFIKPVSWRDHVRDRAG